MELDKMLFARLVSDETLATLLASFNNRPAVFYQRAASADNPRWNSAEQYPRIDYTLDMQEDAARNTSGVLTVNVYCDTEYGAEPELIEAQIRTLLHATFAQADDYPYCFVWVRSDAFEMKTDADKQMHTLGATMVFDIMAFPCQYTMNPDPIKALNLWTKEVLPDAVVLGEDEFIGWLSPTRERPVVYWRMSSQSIYQKRHTVTWMNATIEGHVYARSAADRLYNLAQLNTAAALINHVTMEDTSPLFLLEFSATPHLNYLTHGQIQTKTRFGILQGWYSNPQQAPKLLHVNIPREQIEREGQMTAISEAGGTTIHYPQSGTERAGEDDI